MAIGQHERFEWRHRLGALPLQVLHGIAGILLSAGALAAVVEFYNPDLDNYFITAEPVEQAFIDTGAVGRWQRTGDAFATGGPNQVCRFYGSLSPGPNSHFYTADTAECAALKQLQAITPASEKRWNFESNDFATTPAVNGGCAGGLVPVYRAYNNGFARGVDSNHRITSNYAAYVETVAAGSIGEWVVMCAPAGPPPIATPVGVAIGGAVTATIGAAGGGVSAPDGKFAVTIPPGALAADTAISIQPFTNTAPGKSGAAWRLTPEGQIFLTPITLKFTYTDDDLLGTAAEFLGAAFQTAEGYWQWIGDPTIDAAAKTMSVAIGHFTVIAQVAEYQLTPASKTVKTKGTLGLTVRKCYESLLFGLSGQAPTGSDCEGNTASQQDPSVSVNEWSVNGHPGGGAVFGQVAGSGATATYTAPTTVPIPNPVAVSARVHAPRSARGQRNSLVSSVITIADDSWTGTGTAVYTGPPLTAVAQVTWVLESNVNGVATYRPTGTMTVNQYLAPCIISPLDWPLDPADGKLVVDYNANPPTYHGDGVAHWPATIACPPVPGTFPTTVTALYFGGITDGRGSVSADGTTIEGSDTAPGGVTISWRFTRDP
ncbi:MAG: hypothetical protein KAX84_06525 [Burkholderiales bacterium]|nr:hypothetical protein [Burkholderiales bacterium]